jgi:hypothetical protein
LRDHTVERGDGSVASEEFFGWLVDELKLSLGSDEDDAFRE